MALIRLQDIHFAYPGRPVLFNGLDFTLKKGERVGISGPNGAGKSTMFLLAMGLAKPDSGTVYGLDLECREEKDFRPLREKVGYLFQDPDDQLFCPTVLEDVSFGPRNLGLDKHQALHKAQATLESLGLAGYGERITYQLSGGEKRLVALASVLAMEPEALLLDEPNTGLDEEHAAILEELLLKSDLGWAMVSHDRSFLERTCNSVLLLEQGILS